MRFKLPVIRDSWLQTLIRWAVEFQKQDILVAGTDLTEYVPTYPIGAPIAWLTSVPPPFHVVLNGASLPRTEFPELFNVYGYAYGGSGDFFTLPDMSEAGVVTNWVTRYTNSLVAYTESINPPASVASGLASRSAMKAGDVKITFTASEPGFVLCDGRTIGDASSGATSRANADCHDLFIHLWSNLADAQAAVVGGRGATAEADWAAHKKITLPNLCQRFPLGKAASGTGSTMGGTGGAIDHTHSTPAHYHGMGTGADLSVDLDHDHAAFDTASGGTHSHGVYTKNTLGGTGDTGGFAAKGKDGTSNCVDAVTSTTGAHTHSINVPALGATSEAPTGRIGLVTGGVDGNAAMTSGNANPPYIAVNYWMSLGYGAS